MIYGLIYNVIVRIEVISLVTAQKPVGAITRIRYSNVSDNIGELFRLLWGQMRYMYGQREKKNCKNEVSKFHILSVSGLCLTWSGLATWGIDLTKMRQRWRIGLSLTLVKHLWRISRIQLTSMQPCLSNRHVRCRNGRDFITTTQHLETSWESWCSFCGDGGNLLGSDMSNMLEVKPTNQRRASLISEIYSESHISTLTNVPGRNKTKFTTSTSEVAEGNDDGKESSKAIARINRNEFEKEI